LYSGRVNGPSFVDGFAKNEKDNIEADELATIEKLAAEIARR